MRHIILFSTLLITTLALAQPTITSNNIPQLGDITTIGICSDQVNEAALNASAGAMQTWNFSGLNETSEEQFEFVAPQTTLWSGTFPGSNLCGISWDGGHSYYAVGPDALETVGQAFIVPGTPPEDTLKLNYSGNTERIVTLPYSFGDSFDDTFSGTFSSGTFAGTVNGTVDFAADGYGTLILPNATYTNVVRYHISRVQNNTILGNTSTQTKEQWAWVSADHRFWLLLMELNDDGFGVEPIVWYDKSPTLVGTTSIAEVATVPWRVHPNPLAVGQTLHFELPSEWINTQVIVLDATGRKVLEQQLSGSQLIIPPLGSGTYLLQLIGPDERPSGAKRLFIH